LPVSSSSSIGSTCLEGGVVRDHDGSVEREDEYQPVPVRLESGVVEDDVRRRLGNLLPVVRDRCLISYWHRLNTADIASIIRPTSARKMLRFVLSPTWIWI